MLCEKCKQNKAKFHIVKIVGGEKTTMNLCEECARIYENIVIEVGKNNSIDSIVTNIFETIQSQKDLQNKDAEWKCPQCGLSMKDFKESEKLGCNECFSSFEKNLMIIINNLQGNNIHLGKFPKKRGKELKVKNEIVLLKYKLSAKVKTEEFEDAAIIRDEIKALEENVLEGKYHE